MKTQIALFSVVCANVLLLIHEAAAKERYEQNLERTFQAGPGGKLVVRADIGTINVSTDSSGNVQVKVLRTVEGGTKSRADEVFANHEVKFDQQGNTVSVEALTKNNRFWSNLRANLSVRYEISIPKQFAVELKTSGGNIKVGDLDGPALARTSSGTINFGNVS